MTEHAKTSSIVASIACVLFTTLLCLHLLTEGYYSLLMCGTGILSLALLGFHRIRELDLKNLKLVMDKIEQAKDDIFAREQTVRALAEDVAEIALLTGTDKLAHLLPSHLRDARYEREAYRARARDRVISLLQKAGVDSQKVSAAKASFDELIGYKLVMTFGDFLHSHISEANMKLQTDISQFGQELRKRDNPCTPDEHARVDSQVQNKYKEIAPALALNHRENVFEFICKHGSNLSQLKTELHKLSLLSPDTEKHIDDFQARLRTHGISETLVPTIASTVRLTRDGFAVR